MVFMKILKMILLLFSLIIIECVDVNCQYFLAEAKKKCILIIASGENKFQYKDIKKGDQLILSSKEAFNGYYDAVDLEDELYGLIAKENIKLITPINKNNTSSAVKSSSNSENYEPRVLVYNNTNQKLTISMAGSKYTFKPQERRNIIVNPGKYQYVASSYGIESFFGSETFQTYSEYSWEFYIVQKRK